MEGFRQDNEHPAGGGNVLLVPLAEGYIQEIEDDDEARAVLTALNSELEAPVTEDEVNHVDGKDYAVRTLSTGHNVVYRSLTEEEVFDRVEQGKLVGDSGYMVLALKDPGDTWNLSDTPNN